MKFTSLKPIELVVVALLIIVGVLVVKDVMELKADIHLFRAYLTSSQVPALCPHPGQPAPMICHYTLQIKGPYQPDMQKGEPDKHGWFVAIVPEQVLKTAQNDCKSVRDTNSEYRNLDCIDPQSYPHLEYVIYVAGDVKKDEIWHFTSDPPTNHLIAKEKVQLSAS